MRSRCCDGFLLERGEHLLTMLQLRRTDCTEKEAEMLRLLMFPQTGKKALKIWSQTCYVS